MGIVNKRRRHNVICQKHKRQEKIRKLRARLQVEPGMPSTRSLRNTTQNPRFDLGNQLDLLRTGDGRLPVSHSSFTGFVFEDLHAEQQETGDHPKDGGRQHLEAVAGLEKW